LTRTTVYPPAGGWFKPLTHLSECFYFNAFLSFRCSSGLTRTTVYPPAGGWFKPLTHLSNIAIAKSIAEKRKCKYKR
jgi:hypothetical protein